MCWVISDFHMCGQTMAQTVAQLNNNLQIPSLSLSSFSLSDNSVGKQHVFYGKWTQFTFNAESSYTSMSIQHHYLSLRFQPNYQSLTLFSIFVKLFAICSNGCNDWRIHRKKQLIVGLEYALCFIFYRLVTDILKPVMFNHCFPLMKTPWRRANRRRS